MKKKRSVLIIVALIIIAIVLMVMIYSNNNRNNLIENVTLSSIDFSKDCTAILQQIRDVIEEANYCNSNSDCVISPEFSCEIGCYQITNKNKMSEIGGIVNKYNLQCQKCIDDCDRPPTAKELKCVNNKCIDTRYLK